MSRQRDGGRVGRRWLGLGFEVALIAAAVTTELRKPAGDRTWQGKLLRAVPYDLRGPTLARVRERLWNRADPRILVPTVFGVGWTINLGRLLGPESSAAPR